MCLASVFLKYFLHSQNSLTYESKSHTLSTCTNEHSVYVSPGICSAFTSHVHALFWRKQFNVIYMSK